MDFNDYFEDLIPLTVLNGTQVEETRYERLYRLDPNPCT